MQKLFILLGLLCTLNIRAQFQYLSNEEAVVWADSVLNTLTTRQKIAQLFMIAAYSNKDAKYEDELIKQVVSNSLGGIIFMQGTPWRQLKINKKLQQFSNIPLMVAIDGEWGLSMRLDSVVSFPRLMTLGAINDYSIVYDMGKQIGLQCKNMGIHVNFAPVVDINSNPANPVIGNRSFGEDKVMVANKSYFFMQGMQEQGVLAVAKHFPGHGDTYVDSHYELPSVLHSLLRIDSIEFFPFKELIRSGVGGVMVSHIDMASIDSSHRPATLSKIIVNDLLKNSLNYKGLIFSDALNMSGASKFLPSGKLELEAFKAGIDVLLMPTNVEKAINYMSMALDSQWISLEELNVRCRKVLYYKRVLNCGILPDSDSLYSLNKFNNYETEVLINKIYHHAQTLVKNIDSIVPFKYIDLKNSCILSIGKEENNEFNKMANLYYDLPKFWLKNSNLKDPFRSILFDSIASHDLIIINLLNLSSSPAKKFGISPNVSQLLDSLIKLNKKIHLNIYGSPYTLSFLPNHDAIKSILICYDDSDNSQRIAAQKVFGGLPCMGTLPVSVAPCYSLQDGLCTHATRLGFVYPEDIEIESTALLKIDSIISNAIQIKALPGCQILAIKDSKVFYNKSFGHHTYGNAAAVDNSNLYDIASITKIIASVPLIMHYDQLGLINIDDKLRDYLELPEGSNKSSLRLSDMLTHRAGFVSHISFYRKLIVALDTSKPLYNKTMNSEYSIKLDNNLYLNKNTIYNERFLSTDSSWSNAIQIAHHCYLNPVYIDSIYSAINESKLLPKSDYLYSDLPYYYFQKIVESKARVSFNKIVDSLLFLPIGVTSMMYQPLNKYPKSFIVPTENDTYFRKQLIHGYVHDQGAAMLGGIAGHAGLFANALDVGKVMQMYVNGGAYGGSQLITRSIVEKYTGCSYCTKNNRRGLGFDKPEMDTTKPSPVCKGVSAESYGHSGFTGTLAWADPTSGLIFIFLSNRIHPDADNKKLIDMNIRSTIHQVFIDALIKK